MPERNHTRHGSGRIPQAWYCDCNVEYVCEKGRQDVWSKKWVTRNNDARDNRIAADISGKAEKEKAEKKRKLFAKLADRLEKNDNIKIDESVKELSFEEVEKAISGIESVIKEYPELAETIENITTTKYGIMSCNGTEIKFNPAYFKEENVAELENLIDEMVREKYWPQNTSIESIGVHESGHAVEQLLIKYKPYNDEFQRIRDWNECQTAEEIVLQACENIKRQTMVRERVPKNW